jgi:hypothetical protein
MVSFGAVMGISVSTAPVEFAGSILRHLLFVAKFRYPLKIVRSV